MTAVPNTYSEWVTVLTDFKNKKNDEDVLRAMKAGCHTVAVRCGRKVFTETDRSSEFSYECCFG